MKQWLSRIPIWVLYLVFGLLVAALLAWSSWRTFQESSERQASVEIPALGWVTITLQTVPFPPRAGQPVSLRFSASGGRGEMVPLADVLTFSYGRRGEETPLAQGQARWDNGFHAAEVTFPQPGEYWVQLTVQPGYNVRFLLPVER
ncbi:MAG: hypothetical protein Fur0018_25200 [Anaerolineales bacterium]